MEGSKEREQPNDPVQLRTFTTIGAIKATSYPENGSLSPQRFTKQKHTTLSHKPAITIC